MIDEQTDKRASSFWKELPILLGVAILVAFLVRTFVLQTFYIPSQSMQHTLELNDRVLVNKLVYDFRPPRRGEIVVFRAPEAWTGVPSGEDYIKRVIAVGGDTLRCCDDRGRLLVNGRALDEPYIYEEGGVRDPAVPGNIDGRGVEFEVTVPDGRLWVMGDHRSASGDSYQHWQASNHDMTVATIPEDAVVGRAFAIYWPFDRATWLSVPETAVAVPQP
ncbi:MAG TPA: signal peptidase I [Micromonosporaceae bacterium]